jgi:hypothetical protein
MKIKMTIYNSCNEDAIAPEQKPGTKAGNSYLDIIFEEIKKEKHNNNMILRKILILELCNILERKIQRG